MGFRLNKQKKNKRIYFVYGIFILAYMSLVARLFNLQIINSDELKKNMNKKYTAPLPVPLRGNICDRNGEELAVSLNMSSAYVHPNKVENQKNFLCSLQAFPGININKIKRLFRQKKPFIWIKRKLTPGEENILRGLGLEDIKYSMETKRYYPHTSLASHVIGFAGMDGEGLEGLEFYFDSLLKGKENGRVNFMLSIDRVVQYFADEALNESCEKLSAKAGMLVIMEIDTGDIWAMSNWPTFNPNIFQKYKRENWRARCIADAFEPGSILKVFGAAAVIEEGLGRPNDMINCQQGSIRVAGWTIRDHKKYGKLTLRKVIDRKSVV